MDKLVENAKRFAIKAHGDQRYGDEFPYALHLQAVEAVLIRFGVHDPKLLAVAWLHDVLEDTTAEYEEVATLFGHDVADIVARLTEPKGGNRAWRHKQSYPEIHDSLEATVIKLADRIANVEAGGKKAQMYFKEHLDFKQALFTVRPITGLSLIADTLWRYLDGLIIEL